MDKAEDAFRTISEAAEELDLPQHVLRFWETRFPQIRPLKRGGGRRYYRPDDVELLRAIRHLLYSDGYTIKGVQRMLKERGVRAVLETWREHASTGVAAPVDPARSTAPNPASESDDIAPSRDHEALALSGEELVAHSPQQAHGVRLVAARAPAGTYAERSESMMDGDEEAAYEPAAQLAARPAARFSAEQKRVLEAIAAELAECRRILSAAHI